MSLDCPNDASSKKRKLVECDMNVDMMKNNGYEKTFHMKKLSPEEVAVLLSSSSTESSSVESDEGTRECWAVSKSPLKNPLSRDSLARAKQSGSLIVSPVKLKRKADFVELKNGSNQLQTKHHFQKSMSVGEEIEKEILAQIQNSSEPRQKLASTPTNISLMCSPSKQNSCLKTSTVSSPSSLKENLRKKSTDSESGVHIDSAKLNNFNGSPKKLSKMDSLLRPMKVVLERIKPEELSKLLCTNDNACRIQRKPNLKTKYMENDLAVPLDSLEDSSQVCSTNKEYAGNSDKRNDNKSEVTLVLNNFEGDPQESKGVPIETQTGFCTPRRQIITRGHSVSRSEGKNCIIARSEERCRKAKKTICYQEDDSECSFTSPSESLNSIIKEDVKNLTSVLPVSGKAKNEQTPKTKTNVRTKKLYEMDENSSESTDLSDETDSDSTLSLRSSVCLSVGEHSSKGMKKSQKVSRKSDKTNFDSSSPSAFSTSRMSLRKRSEIKSPLSKDFELYDKSAGSPKTPNQKTKRKTEMAVSHEKVRNESPKFYQRILENVSAKKKKVDAEENISSEPSWTPTSIRKLQLSPLVNSVERISLRNRSEIKKPWGDEFEVDLAKRTSCVNSPKTPSHSLRKQVLESTTRSAKKKLLMDSDDSNSDDDDLIPLRRTPRKTKLQSLNTTPSKVTDTESPSKRTPNKSTPVKSSKSTPKSTPKRKNTPSTPCTPLTVRRVGQGFLTPVVEERSISLHSSTALEELRLKLHLSTVPKSLPCRLNESKNIKSFITCKIRDKTGGCMYISGVPGTGKTASVHAVVKSLQQDAIDKKITPFDFVEINSLRLAEARQAYVRIWQSLSGSKVSMEQALHSLEKKFSGKPSRPTVLLIDELDYVCNKRQDVVYNIMDWCNKKNSKLIVLTIANTMDLPERTLKGRVTSRMGLTRLVFQPYTYQQLQEIVMNRIEGSSRFDPDAVQFVARKVAAVSGDARRALDICRRATELLENEAEQVTLDHVNKTLSQIFQTRRVQAIKHCSPMGKMLLSSIRDETLRTGIEETTVKDVFSHLCSICNLEGRNRPNLGQVLNLCRTLSSSSLIALEKGRHDILSKITLNVSSDDIHYALFR